MLRRKRFERAAPRLLRGSAWPLCLVLLAGSGCSDPLSVTNPDAAQPADLDSPAGLAALRAGAFGDFAKAYGGDATASDAQEAQILATGMFTDEFKNTETDPERIAYDARRIDPQGTGQHLGNFYAVLAGPLVWRQPINEIDFKAKLKSPSWSHPLGTDDLGQDLLARMLYGGRISLAVGIAAMLIAISIGTTIGATSGFVGGTIDKQYFDALSDYQVDIDWGDGHSDSATIVFDEDTEEFLVKDDHAYDEEGTYTVKVGAARDKKELGADTVHVRAANADSEYFDDCTPQQMDKYRGRLSGPLRDRLDLTVDVPALPPELLGATDPPPPCRDRSPPVSSRCPQGSSSRARSRARPAAGRA